jgi:hypothetical protein
MNLFVTCLEFNVDFWEVHKLFKSYDSIFIEVECAKSRVEDIEGEVVVRFDEFKVVAKFFPSGLIILILVVSESEELFNILVGDFGFTGKCGKNDN